MNPKDIPAYPVYHGGNARSDDDGMTLRDYFAAKAMQGMFANPEDGHDPDLETYDEYVAEIARCAFKQADAMMEARK